jgi:hypothetical protein
MDADVRPTEAVIMEFTITCPIDGSVEVGLEDIDTVVLRDEDRADITFRCPQCGTEITVTAIVPAFLLAAIDALAEDTETVVREQADVTDTVVPVSAAAAPEGASEEAYCEYFRRQLASVECVDDAIAEMDSPARS